LGTNNSLTNEEFRELVSSPMSQGVQKNLSYVDVATTVEEERFDVRGYTSKMHNCTNNSSLGIVGVSSYVGVRPTESLQL
jgi:hypothetical protein